MAQDFYRFMSDDLELLRASKARWLLVPAESEDQSLRASRRVDEAASQGSEVGGHERSYLRIALPHGSVELGSSEVVVGRHGDCSLVLESPEVRRLLPAVA